MNRRNLAVRKLTACAVLAVTALTLLGCSSSRADRSGADRGYISGDGTLAEWSAAQRGAPATFIAPKTTTGESIRADTYRGQILVLNFWYAGCPPCRAEAPDLEAVRQKYFGANVSFLGVNIYDTLSTIQSFNATYQVTFPSILDTNGEVMLAFAGEFSPRSVPTTLVLDKQGRVAARILGRIPNQPTLSAIIERLQAEPRHTTDTERVGFRP